MRNEASNNFHRRSAILLLSINSYKKAKKVYLPHISPHGRTQGGVWEVNPPPLEGQKSKNYTSFGRKIHPHLRLHLPLTKDLDHKYTSEQENNMYFKKIM